MGFGIVFGGLGAVGGHVAAWLSHQEITMHRPSSRSGQSVVRPTIINLENVIIIATRYDAASAAETSEIETIYIVGADQSDPSIVTINSAGVLRDAIVQRQTPGRLRAAQAKNSENAHHQFHHMANAHCWQLVPSQV